MRIKSYFAESVRAAMAEAKLELGVDALLLKSSLVPGAEPGKRYEVVFGSVEDPPKKLDAVKPAPAIEPPPSPAPSASISITPAPIASVTRKAPNPEPNDELVQLRIQMGEIQALLAKAVTTQNRAPHYMAELEDWGAALLDQDFDPSTAQAVIKAAAEQLKELPRYPYIRSDEVRAAVREEVESIVATFDISQSLRKAGAVAIVGPPGAGKTTALFNVALTYGLAAKRKVVFVSYDSVHPAGAEKLGALATLLQLPYHHCATEKALLDVLQRIPAENLACIDLPGYSVSETAALSELSATITAISRVDIHLMLPASMKVRDLLRHATLYSRFHPQSVISSRTDETEELGGILSACRLIQTPLSLLTGTQDIPGALIPANGTQLIDALFSETSRAAATAA